MKIIFINVSSKCFLHDTVHSIWVPSASGCQCKDGKMRGKVKEKVTYVLNSKVLFQISFKENERMKTETKN